MSADEMSGDEMSGDEMSCDKMSCDEICPETKCPVTDCPCDEMSRDEMSASALFWVEYPTPGFCRRRVAKSYSILVKSRQKCGGCGEVKFSRCS